jgi:hypothetical protein
LSALLSETAPKLLLPVKIEFRLLLLAIVMIIHYNRDVDILFLKSRKIKCRF